MGNHDVGRAFAAAAEVFWLAVAGTNPGKETTIKALEAVGNRYRRADAEFDDELWDQNTPLGKMVAIAFDAKPEELVSGDDGPEDDGEAWYNGPVARFSKHFEFC